LHRVDGGIGDTGTGGANQIPMDSGIAAAG
jgi:hypothetical protein